MRFLSDLVTNKYAWWTLAASALLLELTALYFQYAMDLAPCIMCVYQRVAVFGLLFAGLIGAFSYRHVIGRIVAYIVWGISAIWGLIIAQEHILMQGPDGFLYTCEYIPNFPKWAPLHEWFPALFEATGDCGEISWQFLSLSMPQWMLVFFSCFVLALFIPILAKLIKDKTL
ncbi:disulfide bond formation protein DsbB [Thalassotalea agarivorans]|uniref:Disulfide bond formation protein B n=1 Tax=Thalassotalea agarivorans TaxID=349064 RepID=A0A1I0BTG0_THASX|nr:disulfide bond formation protein DsbB [Thalassotalea agarivorans]SET10253.1 Thiol:disulfide interchange protein DsbB [Thalassotalea agarivorans]